MADTGSLYREIGALKAAASERTEYYARIIREQAKRIAELECEMETARQYIRDLEMKKNQTGLMNACENLSKTIEKQRAALKKLGTAKRERGKALVEERARRICHVPGDPVGHWARYEPMVVDEAREQLRREGLL